MAHVQSVGARVYLIADPDAPNPAPDGSVTFGCQLFATLPDGRIVMATEPNGLTTDRLPAGVEELEEMILTGLTAPSVQRRVRTAVFGNVVDELARLHIHTDLETLMHLPFHVEVTDEVRALLTGT